MSHLIISSGQRHFYQSHLEDIAGLENFSQGKPSPILHTPISNDPTKQESDETIPGNPPNNDPKGSIEDDQNPLFEAAYASNKVDDSVASANNLDDSVDHDP